MADLEGQILDHYELKTLLGQGGMGAVYVAYDPRFERRVAVKILKRGDEGLLKRFHREARVMASLSHPHLMPVYDIGKCRLEQDDVYYIVMPLMIGGALRVLIKKQGTLPLEQCCRYANELASALDYVHAQGVIHRDIKSANVLLDREGRSYLADFGIAHTDAESTELTTTGSIMGTVGYMAPELCRGEQASTSSDLYAFGVLLYEMVTGHLPFTAETPIVVITMQINNPPPLPRLYVSGLLPQIELVLLKALEKRPEQRYQSATELADAFSQAVTESSAQSKGWSPLPIDWTAEGEPVPIPPPPPPINTAPYMPINTASYVPIQATPYVPIPPYAQVQAVLQKQTMADPEGLIARTSPWGFDVRRAICTAVGIAPYVVMGIVSNNLQMSLLFSATIMVAFGVPIPLFFGILFGPIVGLLVGGLGNIIGSLIIYHDQFWSGVSQYWNWVIGDALIGLVAGRAVIYTISRYRKKRAIVFAEFVAIVIGAGFAAYADIWVEKIDFNTATAHWFILIFIYLILGLILLPILLIAYNIVANLRRRGRREP